MLNNRKSPEKDMAAYVDDLWKRAGKKLRERGVTLADVQKAIDAVRAEKKPKE